MTQTMSKLPDAEYELMRIIWDHQPPMSTLEIHKCQMPHRQMKIQSIMTLLMRLINRGFLTTEKRGKDRIYYPVVKQEDYLKFETERFVKRFYRDSGASLVAALYQGQKVSKEDLDHISEWIQNVDHDA